MKNKYSHLLDLSNNLKDRMNYNNKVFISKKHQAVFTTDGCKLIADRALYPELNVLSELLDSKGALHWDTETQLFEKHIADTYNLLDSIERAVTSQESLKQEKYKIVRLELPVLLKAISKREKKPHISIVLNPENPILALGALPNAIVFNAHYLAPHAGEMVDFYLDSTDSKNASYLMPAEKTLDDAPWFSIIMPVNWKSQTTNQASYIL